MQKDRAEKMMRKAIETVPYYRNKAEMFLMSNGCDECKFESFPKLEKADLQNLSAELIADDYNNQKRKQLFVERTSGSTGKFTNIYWARDDFYKSNLVLWRLRKKWYGITPASRCASFNAFTYSGSRLYRPEQIDYNISQSALYLSKFALSDGGIEECVKRMVEFRPEWMMVQTSVLLRITEYLKREGILLPSLRYIELNGEMVTKSNHEYFDDFYRIPIANMYGATECNAIAYECPVHRMHILEDNVYLEMDENNKPLITSLYNTAMPIIKYDILDDIEFCEEEECICGLRSSYVNKIKGRNTDRVYINSDEYVSPYIFIFCIEKTNELMRNPILQFRIIQVDFNRITLQLVVKNEFLNWKEAIADELRKNLKQNCDALDFLYDVVFVDQFTDSDKTKFKFFENRIGR